MLTYLQEVCDFPVLLFAMSAYVVQNIPDIGDFKGILIQTFNYITLYLIS